MIAGQSNAVGVTTERYGYVYAGIPAGVYKKNPQVWANMLDPVDGTLGLRGSVWPIMARGYLADRAAPIGLVPTAVSGTPSSAWLPGTANYNTMVARALASVASGGTLKAVLWWQGETDSLNGVSQATYHANLAAIAGAIDTDLGIPMIVAKLHRLTALNAPALQAPIDAAVEQAWVDVPNIRQGPDLSNLTADDGVHIVIDSKANLAANQWWAAIKAVFGW